MEQQALDKRVEILEHKVGSLVSLPDRVAGLELQVLQFRAEVRLEFSATRSELRQEMADLGSSLRQEMRALNDETRTQMRVLHEAVLSRFALLDEHMGRHRAPRARAPQTDRT